MIRPTPKILKVAFWTFALCVAIYYAVDTAVRVLFPIKNYDPWGVEHLGKQLDNLDAHYKRHGRIDVLAMGSSIGFHLDVGAWQRETSDTLVCYNFTFPAAYAENLSFLFEKVIYPKYKPKHVVFLETPAQMLNDPGTDDITPRWYHRGIWNSPQVQRLSAETPLQFLWSQWVMTSYLAQTRSMIRYRITNGRHKQGNVWDYATDEYGTAHCGCWTYVPHHQLIGVSRLVEQLNLKSLREFRELCTAKGIGFLLVDMNHDPKTWELSPPGMRELYDSALSRVTDEKDIVHIARELETGPLDYRDQIHQSVFGAERICRYLFNRWISPRLLNAQYAIGSEQHQYFSDSKTVYNDRFTSVQLELTPSEFQLETTQTGAWATLPDVVDKGTYECTVYTLETGKPVAVADDMLPHSLLIEAVPVSSHSPITSVVVTCDKYQTIDRAKKSICQITVAQSSRIRVTTLHVKPQSRLMLVSLSMRKTGQSLEESECEMPSQQPCRLPAFINNIFNSQFQEADPNGDAQYISDFWAGPLDRAATEPVAIGKTQRLLRMRAKSGEGVTTVAQQILPTFVPYLPGETLRFAFTARSNTGSEFYGKFSVQTQASTSLEWLATPNPTKGKDYFEAYCPIPKDAAVKSASVEFSVEDGTAAVRSVRLEAIR